MRTWRSGSRAGPGPAAPSAEPGPPGFKIPQRKTWQYFIWGFGYNFTNYNFTGSVEIYFRFWFISSLHQVSINIMYAISYIYIYIYM